MKLLLNCRESLQIAILLLSSVTVLCQGPVTGIEGQPITLPCFYSVKQTSDITHMCWGRGACPNSKCTQELIWTDGYQVTYQSSPRYQLRGKISEGIVSLTIEETKFEDAGTYCCRIEHRGWFNDDKINVELMVEKAPTTTVRTTVTTTVKTTVTTTTSAPTTTKTTQAPTTMKTSTTPQPVQTTLKPSHVWTNPLTTLVEITTQPPVAVTNKTSPVPPVTWTKNPPSSITSADIQLPNDISAVTTQRTDVTPQSSDIPGLFPDHKMNTTESPTDDKEHTTLLPESLSPNEIENLIQGNDTAALERDRSTMIIAISLASIVLVVICVILLQVKGQKRGHYLFGTDPRLELVTHAEEPMTELQAKEKDPNRADVDKADTNHIENSACETKE